MAWSTCRQRERREKMTEEEVLRRKIKLKRQAIELLIDEILDLQHHLALIELQEHRGKRKQ